MNGYERINAALRGNPTDVIPVTLHNFMMASKEIGASMGQYREDPKLISKAFIHSVEKYGLDGICVDVDTATLSGAVGVPVDYPNSDPARYHGSLINSIEEVKSLKKVNIENFKYVQIWLEAVRLLSDHFGNEIHIRGNCDQAAFSLAASIRGINDFMLDLMMSEESLLEELLEYSCDITCQFIRLMSQTGAHMVSNGDSTGGPDLISATMYERYVLPYERKIVDVAHDSGMYYLLHICGNTDRIMDKMLQTGADAFDIDYKINLNHAFEVMHDKATFFGNVDPSGVLALGTPKLVEEKTIELLEVFSKTNRFVLNSGCALPPDTPEENIRVFIETTRNFR